MQKSFVTALLAVGMLLGLSHLSAEASTVVNIGTLSASHDQLAYQGQLTPTGTADYKFDFTLGNSSNHTPVTLSAASATTVALNDFTIGLYRDDGTSILTHSYSKATTPNIYTGGSVAGTLLDYSGLLQAGSYYLQLIVNSGKANALFNGSIAISAVPIPGALLLFATALGALGFVQFRLRRPDMRIAAAANV
jgi:hypothetical protein